MPVPDFQSFLRPVLELLKNGNVLHMREIRESTASHFKLSDVDVAELLPSGRQSRFNNRVAWAVSFLNAAKLIERPGRSQARITPRGTEELKSAPARITVRYLLKYPEFQAFRSGQLNESAAAGTEETESSEGPSLTPLEQMEAAYGRIRAELATDLLERVKMATPAFFERLVVDLLLRMGYGGSRKDAGSAIGRTGDDGIDGIIKEDRLGLDLVAIQAKRWSDGTVGRPDVQAFSGSLDGQGAKKGVFITTSKFSAEAREYVKRIGDKKIILIDGVQLAELMIDFGVGTAIEDTYEIRKLDSDYFDDNI
jgi:restriction system protein